MKCWSGSPLLPDLYIVHALSKWDFEKKKFASKLRNTATLSKVARLLAKKALLAGKPSSALC